MRDDSRLTSQLIRLLSGISAVLLALALLAVQAAAQGSSPVVPFASTAGGGPDVIDLSSLDVHLAVPVIHKAGAGIPFTYVINFESNIWGPQAGAWAPMANWGWRDTSSAQTGYTTYGKESVGCRNDVGQYIYQTKYTGFKYIDRFGVQHPFNLTLDDGDSLCNRILVTSGTAISEDGSGYTLSVNTASGPPTITSLDNRAGWGIHAPVNNWTGGGSVADPHGNAVGNNGTTYTDTLKTTALTVSGSAPNPVSYTYTGPQGPVSYQLNYGTYTVQTNFSGACGYSDFGPTTEYLVSSIRLPDGTSYTINYESTPGFSGNVTGRVKSIGLPTGGTVSYSYSGMDCTDFGPTQLTRTTPDGTWTYSRSRSGNAITTTVTSPPDAQDPQGNQTVLQFQGEYETERDIYQGLSSTGTLLSKIYTCYNGASLPCTASVGTPFSEVSRITQLGTGATNFSQQSTFYNNYELPTEVDEYAYQNSAWSLLRKTLTVYDTSLGTIRDRPDSVTVENSAGAVQAKTTYSYNAYGDPLSVARLVGGSTWLTTQYTYTSNGRVATITEPNTAQTTFNYSSTVCNGALPTSVSLPMSLSRSMTWNCDGAVMTSATDENAQKTQFNYNDPDYWRLTSTVDAAGSTTAYTYTATSSESSLTFNGNASTVDVLNTVDGLGRPHLQQRRQGVSSSQFDSVEIDYDALGRPDQAYQPYQGTAGAGAPSGTAATTTSHDALGRVLQTVDGGGGTSTTSYNLNDVLTSIGPAPSGENPKKRQLEYDALGRLTSVCELTSGASSGSCGQATAATGYLTSYAYDLLNDLTGVTQNQQSAPTQSRSFVYDDLGRLTSETNPESGTTTYTYDSDATCGSSAGDLVKRTDAAGNVTCYSYDALHRMTAMTYPSGPYASVTPARHFVYDAATSGTTAMTNAKGRLAKAYTGSSDTYAEYFSYDPLGRVTDVWQATPHSGGAYHLTAGWWANGALASLSGLPGLPGWNWQVDGEGRWSGATATTPATLASGVTYNYAGQPLGVTFGSADSDSFGYDAATGRMSSYSFQVNNQTDAGTLTWNTNGSLHTLSITDALNSPNTQTCSYQYDDLGRVSQANCGAPWGQSFTFDPFGNLSKSVLSGSSGTIFAATYKDANQQTSNRIDALPGFTPSYDSDGNLLNDGIHTYAWNSDGQPTTVDGVGLTYDALGRLIEINRNGTVSEVAYAPGGAKLALMSGQSVQTAWAPLPAGAEAVYGGSTLQSYLHADWLGTGRLASTPGRGVYFDAGFAPYGEAYANKGTDVSALSFTGQRQLVSSDLTTGLYDFAAREYAPNQGRWVSPDPAGLGAVDPARPQSWNRYAYVLNRPLALTDPLGLMCEPDNPQCSQRDPTKIGGGAAFWQRWDVFLIIDEMARLMGTSVVSAKMYGQPVSSTTSSVIYSPSIPFEWLRSASSSTDSLGSILNRLGSESAIAVKRFFTDPNVKHMNQCAADESNLLEPNNLRWLGGGKSPVSNLVLGNGFSSASALIFGPDRSSGAAGTAWMTGTTAAAMTFRKAQDINVLLRLTPSLDEAISAKIVAAGASLSKLAYDGVVYTGALVHCGEEAGAF